MSSALSDRSHAIGVGLRNPHFADALAEPAPIDFVEVHSENFFARGGALHQVLVDIAQNYPVSLHSTAMGLGSAAAISNAYFEQLGALTRIIDPYLMSDHASFAWGNIGNHPVHAGDLLPLVYNDENLTILAEHVDHIQQKFGKKLLVENLSAYIELPGSVMSEQAFLSRLTEKTQCGLLVDLNNILVNAVNASVEDELEHAKQWLESIPNNVVGEIHLAGYTQPENGDMVVDDHSQAVSNQCWQLYEYTIQKFGKIPTLIEWDHQLPSWQTLVKQAQKAREISHGVFHNG